MSPEAQARHFYHGIAKRMILAHNLQNASTQNINKEAERILRRWKEGSPIFPNPEESAAIAEAHAYLARMIAGQIQIELTVLDYRVDENGGIYKETNMGGTDANNC